MGDSTPQQNLIPCYDVWFSLSDLVDLLMQSYLTGRSLIGGPLLVSREGETVIMAAFMDRLDKHCFHIDFFDRLVQTATTEEELHSLNNVRFRTDFTLWQHIALNRTFGVRIVGAEIDRLLSMQHKAPDDRVSQHLELAREIHSTGT